MDFSELHQSELGKKSAYPKHYDASLLFPIPRQIKRDEIGITGPLPFVGYDIWNAFEVSWLNTKGKPMIALLESTIPANSDNIIESKSLKLYLNSFNQTTFKSAQHVCETMQRDLADGLNIPAEQLGVKLYTDELEAIKATQLTHFSGINLDQQDITIDTYQPCVEFLNVSDVLVNETVFSNLLKSNCPVTYQPDWGSVQITYTGNKIDHAGLLRYIISFREHNEFHEQCIERLFVNIMQHCQPKELTVYGRYTRRGGLDINPIRSNNIELSVPNNYRLFRQ